jgi:hypothetical protein
MPAQDVDGVAAHAHAGPGKQAGADSLTDRGVCRTGAFRAHVALGGETSHQVEPRRIHRNQGALRHALLDGLQVFGAGVEEEMHMGVDHAGHQRGVAEIDHLGRGRGRRGRCSADRGDAVARDHHQPGRDHAARLDIEHASRLENGDGLHRFLLAERCGTSERTSQQQRGRHERLVFCHSASINDRWQQATHAVSSKPLRRMQNESHLETA